MPRSSTVDVPVDTSLFSPTGLQTRPMLSLGMSGWANWLLHHWIPFPSLIQDQQLGVVVAAFDLELRHSCAFFDAAVLRFDTAVCVREDGRLLYVNSSLSPRCGDPVMFGRATLRPVRIDDGLSLAAQPCQVTARTRDAFQPDEVVKRGSPGCTRQLPILLGDVERTPVVGQLTRPFTITRSLCEVADQWSAVAVPDLAAAVREELAAADPLLAWSLNEPLRALHVEFRRAAFFLDTIVVQTTAHDTGQGVAFVHRYVGSESGSEHAVLVELFSRSAQ